MSTPQPELPDAVVAATAAFTDLADAGHGAQAPPNVLAGALAAQRVTSHWLYLPGFRCPTMNDGSGKETTPLLLVDRDFQLAFFLEPISNGWTMVAHASMTEHIHCWSQYNHGHTRNDKAKHMPLLAFLKDGTDRSRFVPFTIGAWEDEVDALPQLFDADALSDWRVRRPSVAAPEDRASFDITLLRSAKRIVIHFTADGMARSHMRTKAMSVYRRHDAVPPPTLEQVFGARRYAEGGETVPLVPVADKPAAIADKSTAAFADPAVAPASAAT